MKRPISPGLSPNLEKKDALLVMQMLWKPFFWKKGKYILALEQWFERYFKGYHASSFTSGRGALFAILNSMGIKKGDEVMLQAFTCAAVPQAIIAAGAKPIYVDIDETLTMKAESLVSKINSKTKAIIFQYTFGNPGNIEQIKKIATERKIFLIEDCAHLLGITYKNKKLGTLADASIFSFGRDKAFSSVAGGMSLTKDIALAKKIHAFQKRQQFPSFLSIFQNLFHVITMYFSILPLYDVLSIGKIKLVVLQKIHLLSKPVIIVFDKSFSGEIKKMSNAQCALALHQVKNLERFNEKRIQNTKTYNKFLDAVGLEKLFTGEFPYLRLPLLIKNPQHLKKFFRSKKIYVGDWYSNCIDPKGIDFASIQYQIGMCPRAEEISRHIINLPTYPTMSKKDVGRVMQTLRQYANDTSNNK